MADKQLRFRRSLTSGIPVCVRRETGGVGPARDQPYPSDPEQAVGADARARAVAIECKHLILR